MSAWLKHYDPAAFCGALLNSQPMGFYAPSQLVQDARRHGVEVRPVDVTVSEWDCTLEAGAADRASPALRLGLRHDRRAVARPGAAADRRARATSSRSSTSPISRTRARSTAAISRALADADALASLAGHRHGAVWDVAGVERLPPLLAGSTFAEGDPRSAAADRRPGHRRRLPDARRSRSRRHPLALLREQLRQRRLVDRRRDRATRRTAVIVRTAGIVIGRQRPDTASGVVFVTLEDETGATNVIVWRDLGDRQRRELLGSKLMAVYGTVEREGAVVHLVAGHLVDLSPMLGTLSTRSRDFH